MLTAGIDCGAKSTKTIILKDGKIVGRGSVLTGFDQEAAVNKSFEAALKAAGVSRDDVERIGGTGSGSASIKDADNKVNDIKVMAKAANYFFPNSRTVTDVGAEEGRAVKIDEKGNVVDFAINEKCAAGAGAFIEAMARALEISLEDIGPLCLKTDTEIPMNAQCAIFAESEVVSLISDEVAREDICRAVHDGISERITSMAKRVGIEEKVGLIGGAVMNKGLVQSIKDGLDTDPIVLGDPQFVSALGMAVLAAREEG